MSKWGTGTTPKEKRGPLSEKEGFVPRGSKVITAQISTVCEQRHYAYCLKTYSHSSSFALVLCKPILHNPDILAFQLRTGLCTNISWRPWCGGYRNNKNVGFTTIISTADTWPLPGHLFTGLNLQGSKREGDCSTFKLKTSCQPSQVFRKCICFPPASQSGAKKAAFLSAS